MVEGGGVGEGGQGGAGSGAEVLPEVVPHVLAQAASWTPWTPWTSWDNVEALVGPVSGASVLTHLLSARKQFSTLGAGNLLLVRPVLTDSLKREEVIIEGS